MMQNRKAVAIATAFFLRIRDSIPVVRDSIPVLKDSIPVVRDSVPVFLLLFF
jgi:hypothetical protein